MIKLSENNSSLPITKALGYKELVSYIKEEISFDEAITKATQVTRNYAKRQLTWFRHQLPHATTVDYDDINQIQEKIIKLSKDFLNKF